MGFVSEITSLRIDLEGFRTHLKGFKMRPKVYQSSQKAFLTALISCNFSQKDYNLRQKS